MQLISKEDKSEAHSQAIWRTQVPLFTGWLFTHGLLRHGTEKDTKMYKSQAADEHVGGERRYGQRWCDDVCMAEGGYCGGRWQDDFMAGWTSPAKDIYGSE